MVTDVTDVTEASKNQVCGMRLMMSVADYEFSRPRHASLAAPRPCYTTLTEGYMTVTRRLYDG